MQSTAPFDPADPGFVADPYPVFDALRGVAAVHEHPGLGMRVAVAHPTCTRVLRDRRFARIWVDARPAARFAAFNRIHATALLSNTAGHGRLRTALSGVFARRNLDRLRPIVRRWATELVAALAARVDAGETVDLLEAVAAPLSVGVIAEWLGFPDAAMLRPWSNAIVKMDEVDAGPAAQRAAEEAARDFGAAVAELLRTRRAALGEDLFSELVAAADAAPDGLTDDELVANYILLLMAGHEASVNALGNAVVALHAHPAQWQRLRAGLDDRDLETAADELIRYDTPNQLFVRTAVEPVRLDGHRFAPGERVGVLLGAANRDPAVFTDPGVLDLSRAPNPHLALGGGIHYCLGAPLARLELATALGALATRVPGLHVVGKPLRRAEFVIRGYQAVPVAG